MKLNRISKIIYILSFIIIICSLWLLWALFGKYFDQTNYENRTLTARPTFSVDNYSTYADEYETYYNDNIPFRNSFTELHSKIDYFIFKKAANDNVAIGKNDWLFYADESDGDPIACYQGTNLFPKEDLQAMTDNMLKTRDLLAEKGVEFVIFIAPNKERIYSDMMPGKYGEPAPMYAALQVVNYLKQHTDLRIVYPYQDLMNAKQTLPNYNLYFMTDTHWNSLGGYIGSIALLNELGIQMPSVTDPSVKIEETSGDAGDLAAILGLSRSLGKNEKDYIISGYDTHDVTNDIYDFNTVYEYHCNGADNRAIYIVRDSFCIYMAKYIGSQFNISHMRYQKTYSYADFTEQNADIFVYETVERYIGNLATFDIEQQ